MLKGYIDEVFVSIQGEGVLVGTPMLFIRFGGCEAGCEHCDTPRARTQMSQFTVHGVRNDVMANPVKVADLASVAMPLLRTVPYLAVTGGEPLEQPGFLSLLLTQLSTSGKKVLLESRSYHVQELKDIIPRVDIIAADIKLQSFTGGPSISPDRTAEFLRAAAQKYCYVKVVVGPDTAEAEVFDAARLVASVRPEIPFIIQPRSDNGPIAPDEARRLAALAVRLTSVLADVRFVPQVHRLLGLR